MDSLKKYWHQNNLLIIALIIGLVFHGSTLFYTLEKTYDALIHLYFADHYASDWFNPWDDRWYTGFTVMGYPPLVHQLIGAFSFIGGLKFGMYLTAFIIIILFITGVYRFSYLLTLNFKIAGYAALFAVFAPSFMETLHIFGQLPSLLALSVLMHSFPYIYLYIKNGGEMNLIKATSLLAITVCSHHVTPIFGMVFFIFPLIGMVLMDKTKLFLHNKYGDARYDKKDFLKVFISVFYKSIKRIVSFGGISLVLFVVCILPYWVISKTDPITQVPIPHGSRDDYLGIYSSGLVFFLIPWGVILFILPYIFYRFYNIRYIFYGFSFTLLFILGTGGTTPIPKIILGENAFNILTLDRFTLWASMMSLPIVGEFIYRFSVGDFRDSIIKFIGIRFYKIIALINSSIIVLFSIFIMSVGYFRPFQPDTINVTPIVSFLSMDFHYKWRFMTLGFGDQMAWLSSQTNATSVDGNYHSARRIPELTTRSVERLVNSGILLAE